MPIQHATISIRHPVVRSCRNTRIHVIARRDGAAVHLLHTLGRLDHLLDCRELVGKAVATAGGRRVLFIDEHRTVHLHVPSTG